MLENFLVKLLRFLKILRQMLLEDMVAELKEKLQDDKVVLGLSGE
jgi:GMP synthase (glutamine-hydrolysing)